MPGLPVHHSLPQFTQTHVHWVGDGIQPTHPLSSALSPAFNLSQNQGLFQWVGSLHQVAKVLEFQLQHQSFQWTFRMFTVRTVQNTNSTPVLGHVFLVVQLLGHFQLFAIWWLHQTRLFCSHYLSVCSNYVHWVGDSIQPSHPQSSPSPPAFNLSKHQGLFQWVGSSHQAKVLELQLQHQSFKWVFRVDFF